MSADLHIHVATENITEDHFKCFFSHTLGSKWFGGFGWSDVCPYEQKREADFEYARRQFDIAFPEWHNKALVNAPKEVSDKWSQLLKEHYKRVGYECVHHEEIGETPNVWIGEVSWLKAALFEDSDTYVPDPVGEVNDIIGEELPVIDDALINRIKVALGLTNQTQYSISGENDVVKFLETYKGYRVFTVSW